MTRELRNSSDVFDSLRALHAKLEAHWSRVTDGVSIECSARCVSCCHTRLSVCRVEADYIRAGIAAGVLSSVEGIPDSATGPRWVLGNPEVAACAFLSPEGVCRIYPFRPLICRSHGIPVSVDGDLDVCPANRHLSRTVPPLNLELLNTLLFAIDGVYCREQHLEPGRVSLDAIAAGVMG